uniref:Uncharacterized protein n=1 Tax=Rhizophora mucronata TaxID=61149 RepID=A0A2P2NDX1_RHIMU
MISSSYGSNTTPTSSSLVLSISRLFLLCSSSLSTAYWFLLNFLCQVTRTAS